MKSVMRNTFQEQPRVTMPRSRFDRSHAVKTTFDAGYLIPIFRDLAYPGDTMSLNVSGMGRLATPIYPVMDNMVLDIQFYAVPLRILQDNFRKIMGEQDNPGDSVDFVTPKISAGASGWGNSGLYDYLGYPTGVANLEHHNYFGRAYVKIFNHWYKDQQLQDSETEEVDDGPDNGSFYGLKRRGKRHDYFTSCLPSPQRGPAQDLPLGTSAPVTGSITAGAITVAANGEFHLTDGTNIGHLEASGTSDPTDVQINWDAGSASAGDDLDYSSGLSATAVNPTHSLSADLSNATAATINQWRQALQVQRMYEIDARGGTRLRELIYSHFGVTVPDFRVQFPEFLGSGTAFVNVNPVTSTNAGSGTTAGFGQVGAFGTCSFTNIGFTKSFVEHSVILGLASVRADLTYQQGLWRQFSIDDKLDFYWPSLAQIGEQAVLNKEIYAQGPGVTDASGNVIDDEVFGYQSRFEEMRTMPSYICGHFRSNYTAPLDSWHLSEEFSSLPTLNSDFIEDDPPIDRVIRVTTEPHFIFDFYHKYISARPLPINGIPAGIGRF